MPNRLAGSTSPYLRQHADNPVDWYPWSDEAFREAAERDVPVLISIGYAACHWCHVMAHESFDDEEVGRLLNAAFVCVKVDREEHPVVDHFYMSACTAMGQQGGWPLTVIATPQRQPFFVATYLPRRSRYGRIGLIDLIERIREAWRDRRDEVVQFGEELVRQLGSAEVAGDDVRLSDRPLVAGLDHLRQAFDAEFGGFGPAPKFPSAHQLSFLFRASRRFGDAEAAEMALVTLRRMQEGGIRDHVGGGFHRYATDCTWTLPHFEKMLIDQAWMLVAYAEGASLSGEASFAQTARSIVGYVRRDLRHPDGMFFASEDADSDGEEGRFYLWEFDELRRLLADKDLEHLIAHWHVRPEGNVNDEATGNPTGLNLLYESAGDVVGRDDIFLSRLAPLLLEARSQRNRPLRDEKILTDWNGAMIGALAMAGRILNEPSWIQMAIAAATNLFATARDEDGELAHSTFQGRTSERAFLDDYAFLTFAALELLQSTGDPFWLDTATDLSTRQIDHFFDDATGGFFLSDDRSGDIPVRQKSYFDAATPSGAAVSAMNLLRLDALLAKNDFREIAERQLAAAARSLEQFPSGFCSALSAIDFAMGPVREIIMAGGGIGTPLWRRVLEGYRPNAVLVPIQRSTRSDLVDRLPFLEGYEAVDDRETIYVCTDRSCSLPATDSQSLDRALG